MNKTMYAFLLTTIAGTSTLIGAIPIFFKKLKTSTMITISLAFAAGVMLTVSCTDLMPNSFAYLNTFFLPFPSILICAIFIVVGIIFSMLIDTYLPTSPQQKNQQLYKVGIFSMIAIILHNVPEGIATFMTSTNDLKLGITLTIAITLHNIPEGISIAVPIFYATQQKRKAIFYTFISGISELFGAIIAYLFLAKYMTDTTMGILFSLIAGIMIHISIYELIPTSKSYRQVKLTYKSFFIGIIFMLLSHIFMN